jgi:endonuclease/exonuclease/phosphatase family metal-dependent hydrolase
VVMRVLTYNVLSYGHADGPRRSAVVRAELARLRPDVVALQEVTRTPAFDQARELLGAEFTIVDHPGATDDGVGACLAARWPVGTVQTLDLHLGPDADEPAWAAAVAAEVDGPLGPVLVVHHKPSWPLDREHVRERQAVAVVGFVRELTAGRADLPVVLLGDFDAGPAAASIRFLAGRQSLAGIGTRYEDAWEATHPGEPGHTFSRYNPLVTAGEMPLERGRRIDHVMVRSGPHGPPLDVVDCRLVLDEPVDGVWASDHFGVLADLTRPAHPPGTWS